MGNAVGGKNRRTLAYRKADATKSRTTSGKGTSGGVKLQFERSPGGRERSGLRLQQGGRGTGGALRRLILWGSNRYEAKARKPIGTKARNSIGTKWKNPTRAKGRIPFGKKL